jgi:nucleotide-binding universal stress UspA family protein
MYSHILIPTDGSQVAQKGVDHGLSLAKAIGAKVTLLTASERFPDYVATTGWALAPNEMTTFEEGQARLSKEILTRAQKSAELMGVAAEVLYMQGSFPADAIVEVAGKRQCDLIVMSSHGRRGFERVVLGSQTTDVLARSTVPVLVVR